ncbi:MAG: EsaB/YukD family protein [Acidimicrobiales bacterium]
MSSVNVTVMDVTGSRRQEATLPADVPVVRVLAALVERMGLPTLGPDGGPISYRFHHRDSGRQLSGAETLSNAGVLEGHTLRLQPEIIAG